MNSFGYFYSCMLSFILFPLVLPSAEVLRKATQQFMAPAGTETLQGQGDSGILIWTLEKFLAVLLSGIVSGCDSAMVKR